MKKTLFIIAVVILTIAKVNASDVFINSNNVEIPIEKYNYLKEYYHEKKSTV